MTIIGVDLGGTNVRGNLSGTAVCSGSRRLRSAPKAYEILEDVSGAFLDPLAEGGLEGIGIGVPSVVDLKKGVVYDVQNLPSWKTVPLRALLEKRRVRFRQRTPTVSRPGKYFGAGLPYENICC